MIKNMICVECPRGCMMSVEIERGRAVNIKGYSCPKGIAYAAQEAENPSRILTATILSDHLSLKFIPVRTDKPIPKKDIFRAMDILRQARLKDPVRSGDVILENFLGLNVKIIATRTAGTVS